MKALMWNDQQIENPLINPPEKILQVNQPKYIKAQLTQSKNIKPKPI